MEGLVFSRPEEETMLRSMLIFNSNQGRANRDTVMQRAIVALMASNGSPMTPDDIAVALNRSFGVILERSKLESLFPSMQANGMIRQYEGRGFVPTDAYRFDSEKDLEIDRRTDELFQSVEARIDRASRRSLMTQEKTRLRDNIRRALTSCIRSFAYSLLDLKDMPGHDTMSDAAKIAVGGLPGWLGDAVVMALADLIENPSVTERETLEMWARAFVTLQMVNLDSRMRAFRTSGMRDLTFVIDTDVTLHALTSCAKYSASYRSIMDYLKTAGCRIVIPEAVLREVYEHSEAARKRYERNGETVVSFDDMMLQTDGNVFIEDYARQKRDGQKRELSFESYRGNFVDDRLRTIHDEVLVRTFGTNFTLLTDSELLPLESEESQKMNQALADVTSESAKGLTRQQYKNERIAEYDARLFATIKDRNEREENRGDLNRKTYLVTASKKTCDCLRQLKIFDRYSWIVCNPRALVAIVNETGVAGAAATGYLNLFENPFLVHAGRTMNDLILPLLVDGRSMRYDEIQQLRMKAVIDRDAFLTQWRSKAVAVTEAAIAEEETTRRLSEQEAEIAALREQLAAVSAENARITSENRKLVRRRESGRRHYNNRPRK